MPLKREDFLILLVLSRGERHGYGIMKEVESESSGDVAVGIGSLYRTAGLGLVLGLLASAVLSRAIGGIPGLLHGISALDAPTYAVVAIVLIGVVLLASFPPASKASRIAPVEALRHE
jgi:hypothetical protein